VVADEVSGAAAFWVGAASAAIAAATGLLIPDLDGTRD
jgi:hypothetical protein